MHALFPKILAALRADASVVLATVVKQRGSLPMAHDAKLLIFADGTTHGTIGGGCLEAEVYGRATQLLRHGGASVDEFHLNEVEEGIGGHVCGGTAVVLTRAFQPRPEVITFIEDAVALRDVSTDLQFVSRLHADAPGHALVDAGRVAARLDAADGFEAATEAAGLFESDSGTWFYESVRAAPLLIVFGAGHCGAAIGAAAATTGYRVWMLEDRPTFLDAERMPWAERLRHVDFAALPPLPLAAGTALAIVTRGHEHDLVLLRQLLDAPVDYIGMIGSRRKRALFQTILRDEDRDLEAFARVRSPMGLDIGAQSPAEIAVSVVAELIATRRALVTATPCKPSTRIAAEAT
jgi:xanthine dehydrogenase accessory factor